MLKAKYVGSSGVENRYVDPNVVQILRPAYSSKSSKLFKFKFNHGHVVLEHQYTHKRDEKKSL